MAQARWKQWGRAAWRLFGTVNAVGWVAFFGLAFASLPSEGTAGGLFLWHTLGFLGAIPAGVAMIWREKYPVAVLVGSSVAAIVLPLSPLGPALALSWFIAARPARELWWGFALAAAGVGLPLLRDYQAPPLQTLFMTKNDLGGINELDPLGYFLVGLTLLALAGFAGAARRWRSAAHVQAGRAEEQGRQVRALEVAATRQEERNLIAREMHDTLAHHLSLVSLQAGALEVTSTDPEVPERAQNLRESAHQALDELRSIIYSLREGDAGDRIAAVSTFGAVEQLVEQTRAAGVPVVADVQVADQAPPPALARGTFRILQESITNALRHGQGGGPVEVRLQAAVGAGVELSVINPLASERFAPPPTTKPGSGGSSAVSPVPSPAGSGTGTVGMAERAAALGGSLTSGQVGERWVVAAFLPWVGAETGN